MNIGDIIIYNGIRMKCTKKRQSGYHTFQIVDENDNPVVIRDEKCKGVILDNGIRVINIR